ncbi:MAG: hypothetical protein LBB47_02730 [Spirochaetaceae bacterium]|jgi:hypothetical protein|nr:hypothetical protein [Spirochaetaceae bacterium]
MRKISNTVCAALFTVFMLASCDDFFSSSWGTMRDYDLSKIKLTLDNLQELKEKAVGNPELAGALVEKIIRELDGKSGAEKAAFQEAGIDLAIEQSGIGTSILELAGKDIANMSDETGLQDLLGSVQNKFNSGNGKAAARNIATIVDKSLPTSGQFPPGDQYVARASASDVGMAVAVLALAVMPDIGSSDKDLKAQMNDGNKGISISGNTATVKSNATHEEIAFAAYLNLILRDPNGKYDGNPITSGIKSAFGS